MRCSKLNEVQKLAVLPGESSKASTFPADAWDNAINRR